MDHLLRIWIPGCRNKFININELEGETWYALKHNGHTNLRPGQDKWLNP